MGNSASSVSQVISLPQGGGALHGIGEKFSPDLFTGTGNFTIPLVVPSGRQGFQPSLSLVYSTGSGNGPFGLAWSLSIPGISRKTSQGIPIYDDTKDTFLLSGAEDLVPVAEDATGTISYRPRTEGLFAHIRHLHKTDTTYWDTPEDYWEVRSKDGSVSLYGSPRPANGPAVQPDQPRPAWRDPAIIADPDHPERVFVWKLTSTVDPFGNRIEYLYKREISQRDGPHFWEQTYLSEIRYIDYAGENNGPTRFLVSVTFDYDEKQLAGPPLRYRPDPFSEYRAGFEIRTLHRYKAIRVTTHTDEDRPVRTYHLLYLDQRALPADQLPLNGVSLLSQVRVEGHDADISEWLPPLEFTYTTFSPDKQRFFPITGPNMPPLSLGSPNYELVDLLGNGLPDVLQINGSVRYWRNTGNGQLDWPQEIRTAPGGLRLADPGVQMIDANGDGRIDLLVTQPGLAGYFPTRFGGMWDKQSFQPYQVAPSFDLKDPEVCLVDLDGDGVTDAIRSGTSLECFFNDRQHGWTGTRLIPRKSSLDDFPNITFSDSRVRWADMTGDGLQDIVLLYDRSISYWPTLGRGDWGKRVCMTNSPHFPWGYDSKRILLGDIDGDGLADLVYVEDTRVTLWINQSGNNWSDPIIIEGTPPVFDTDAIRLADMCGNGVNGVLWSADGGELPRSGMFFLDLTGGTKPYLLHEMDNHLGATTRVEYSPSTRFYLADEQRAETRWQTPLPFPVQVVAKVEIIDSLSGGKLTSEYAYHHGYWDGAESEFRGFGRVDQRDTETFDAFHSPGLNGSEQAFNSVPTEVFAPPMETRAWFHQGPIGDEFGEWTETDFSAEFWSGDQQVLARPASVTQLLDSLPRRARRDALRALRGQMLRSEIYALDGSTRQSQPYTITECLSGLREVSPPPPGEPERLHIFFAHALAQRITQWERGDDPQSQFTFLEDYDQYGQTCTQIALAVPRGRDFLQTTVSDTPYQATMTRISYAQRDDASCYLVDRVASTTTYEIINDGSQALTDLHTAITAHTAPLQVIGQEFHFFDGPAFQGLPSGQLGDYGALVRTETLVFTQAILEAVYQNSEVPPYLVPGTPQWTADYPQAFQELLPPLAGYRYQPDSVGSPYTPGYYAVTEQLSYDFQVDALGKGRGQVLARRDPLGHDVSIVYETPYDLLPIQVTDAISLTTQATYDYRVLQPEQITDTNGNRTVYSFTPLGNLASTAVMGKLNEADGDTLATPGISFLYDFMAFVTTGQPASVRTIQRLHHINEANVAPTEQDDVLQKAEYSDGFGRLLQTRIQAEDVLFDSVGLSANQTDASGDAVGTSQTANAPRVVVSGWQQYDNKGQVVEKYEPFFSASYDYAAPQDSEYGQKARLDYDARGHLIRTINPDGSERRVIYGVPGNITAPDLSNPDVFEPTPWEVYTYDANDNAGRTHPATSTIYQSHWNTPSSIVIDALGRTVQAVVRNGANLATDWYTTYSTYDIRGNLLTVNDALGRLAFSSIYDLTNQVLYRESLDAGVQRMLLDATGNLIEQRDSKGSLLLCAYDLLNRALRCWARDNDNDTITLRQRIEYGDGSDPNQPAADRAASKQVNLLDKVALTYDEAGLLTFDAYDFKGNLLEKARRVINDTALLAVFSPPPADWLVQPFRIDWQPPAGTSLATYATGLLEAIAYHTSWSYDALSRVKTLSYPQDVSGTRKQLLPHYNQAGGLESVALDADTYVERIAYNARGQRVLIAYGNGIMTRYVYDLKTFRLSRLRSEGYTTPASFTYSPSGAILQDLAYVSDLQGNITGLQERTPASGITNTLLGQDALDRIFTYDPLYRLLSASGREGGPPPTTPPWNDLPRPVDPTLVRAYTEYYLYDQVSNLLQLRHQTNGAGYTRGFTLATGSNQLATLSIDANTAYSYAYDTSGNLLQEATSRFFEWDQGNHLRVYRTQTGTAEPSVYTHYLYDASGQRVKKLVRKQGGAFEVTIAIDSFFEYHRQVQGNNTQENNTLHVLDNQQRIALVRVGTPFADDTLPAITYHLSDHLGSSTVVIDNAGAWTNREEYLPYGETSFGSAARKRYRFTGKERDEESGLSYHGARYYAPWLARWMSCDPAGMVDGTNLYLYGRNNPLTLIDTTGLAADPPAVQHWTFDPVAITVRISSSASTGTVATSTPPDPANSLAPSIGPTEEPDAKSSLDYWEVSKGILMGTIQANIPLIGPFLPSPRPDSPDFELGRAATMFAIGVIQLMAGIGGGMTGMGIDLGGVAFAGLGGVSLLAEVPGTVVAAAGAAMAVQGAANIAVGAINLNKIVATPWGRRDTKTGKFTSGGKSGPDPEKSFKAFAEAHGIKLMQKIRFKTPFGIRIPDFVYKDAAGQFHGIELKSSASEFDRFRPQQFAADRWINMFGGEATGEEAAAQGVKRIVGIVKINWPP